MPRVGDRVMVEASYNPSMPFKWNAYRIQLPQPQDNPPSLASTQNHHQYSRNNVQHGSNNRWQSDRREDNQRQNTNDRSHRQVSRRSPVSLGMFFLQYVSLIFLFFSPPFASQISSTKKPTT